MAELEKTLQDPVLVHVNMLAGKIARPSPRAIAHLYADQVDELRRALDEMYPESLGSRS